MPWNPDALVGDVVVHTQDDVNGIGLGQARVVWVAPANGTIDVAGGVWMVRALGRSNDWSVSIAGNTVAMGSISDGDAFDRASPFTFAAGATGSLTGVPVTEGQEVALELVKTHPTFGDFAGANMTITLTH